MDLKFPQNITALESLLIPILFGNNNNHLVGNTLSTVILRVLETINFSNWKYERIKIDVVT